MELAIESVGVESSVAVSDEGRTIVEVNWHSGRRHTPSLVPTIDYAVRRAGIERSDLRAVFVDVGPGAYGGIRAGMATAEALAVALSLSAVGVGRLEIEAYAQASAGRIAALHAAGRDEWALALYRGPASSWCEEAAPTLQSKEAMLDALTSGEPGALCGDVGALDEADVARLTKAGWIVTGAAASMRRASLLAELGWRRLQAGGDFAPVRLQPMYLREPAIGPQPAPPAKT